MKRMMMFLLAFALCFLFLGTYGFENADIDGAGAHALHAEEATGEPEQDLYMQVTGQEYKPLTGLFTVKVKIGLASKTQVKSGTITLNVATNSCLSNMTVNGTLFGLFLDSSSCKIDGSAVTITIPEGGGTRYYEGEILMTFSVDEKYLTYSWARTSSVTATGQVLRADDKEAIFDTDATTDKVYICDHPTTSTRKIKEETCYEAGTLETYCTVCGCSMKTEAILPDGQHVVDLNNPLKIEVAATCLETGWGQFKCSRCGKNVYKEIPKTAHTLGARYLKEGIYYQTCSVCKAEFKSENQCSHDPSAYVLTTTTTEPTCRDKGLGVYKCPYCSVTEEREIPATGKHTVESWKVTVDATCTTAGQRVGTCTVCNDDVTEAVKALGHSYSEWVTEKAATCTTEGKRSSTCTRCRDIKTDTIPMTAHTYGDWIVEQQPTCVTEGKRKRVCSGAGCGAKQEESIAVVDHTYSEWFVTKTATCNAGGEEARQCRVCNKYETRLTSVDADAHRFGEWETVTTKTCTTNGQLKRTCASCGSVETQVDSCIGHQFGNSVIDGKVTTKACGICGYKESVKTVTDGVEKTLTDVAGSICITGTNASKNIVFECTSMAPEEAATYRAYQEFDSAYTYTIRVDGTEISITPEMTLNLTLDATLEKYDISVVVLKDRSFYSLGSFRRKGTSVTITGDQLVGADAIFVVKGTNEQSSFVLPIIIVVLTLVIAVFALAIVLSKNKNRGNSF